MPTVTIQIQPPQGARLIDGTTREYTINNFVYNLAIAFNVNVNAIASNFSIYKNDFLNDLNSSELPTTTPFINVTKVSPTNSQVWQYIESNKLVEGNYKYTVQYKDATSGVLVRDYILLRVRNDVSTPLPVINNAFIYGLNEIYSNLKISANISISTGFIDSVALYRKKNYSGDWQFVGNLQELTGGWYELIDLITDNLLEPTDYFYKIVALSNNNKISNLIIGTVIKPSSWVQNDLNIQHFTDTNPATYSVYGGGHGLVNNLYDQFNGLDVQLNAIYNYDENHSTDFIKYAINDNNGNTLELLADINSLSSSFSGLFKTTPTEQNPNIIIINGYGLLRKQIVFNIVQRSMCRFTLTIWDCGSNSNQDQFRMVINSENSHNLDHDSGIVVSSINSGNINLNMNLIIVVSETDQNISSVVVNEVLNGETVLIENAILTNQMSLSDDVNMKTYYCSYVEQGVPTVIDFKNLLININYLEPSL